MDLHDLSVNLDGAHGRVSRASKMSCSWLQYARAYRNTLDLV